jgi:hypothetical protein
MVRSEGNLELCVKPVYLHGQSTCFQWKGQEGPVTAGKTIVDVRCWVSGCEFLHRRSFILQVVEIRRTRGH